MPEPDVVHAAPQAGLTFTGCCDRTLQELPPYERISYQPDQVTCGRLSHTDELVLSGRPFVAEHQNSEQLLFDMAVSVRNLCGPAVSLQSAYDQVRSAVFELVPVRDPAEFWSASLMVRITARATELAGY
ncbi:MAG: hypothetical protein M3Y42_13520 [Actinomycetota bacterium]|nr:hypothetical protein [Actinomycetota bacterium]MDQ2957973.1 hypothetical protein [Actinomycetota bacterium]